MENKKYQTFGTFPKSNRNIVESGEMEHKYLIQMHLVTTE